MTDSIWDKTPCEGSSNSPENCGRPMLVCGELAPSQQLLMMYYGLVQRMELLEEKYCECVGGGPSGPDTHVASVEFDEENNLVITLNDEPPTVFTTPIPIPEVEHPLWRSDVVSVEISEEG